MDNKRKEIIEYGVKNGYGKMGINQALAKNSQSPLTVAELQRAREGIPLDSNILQNFGRDIKSLASGIPALGGAVINYARSPEYRTQVNREVSEAVRKKGTLGVATDVANTLLAPSNLKIGDFGKNPVEFANRLIAGISNHPGYFALDVALPATGAAKGLGLIPKGNIVGNVLEKANLPGTSLLQKYIPSDKVSAVNTAINQSRNRLNAKYNDLMGELNVITAKPGDNVQANRNLMGLKAWSGDTATINKTKELQEFYGKYNQELKDMYSLPDNVAKENTVAQGIVEELNPRRDNPNIYYGSVEAALRGDKQALASLGITQERLNQLKTIAEEKYNQGLMSPISYRFNYKTAEGGSRGRFSTYDSGRTGMGANRVWGMDTVEGLTKTVPEAYRELSNKLVANQVGGLSLRNVTDSLGRKITKGEQVSPNEVIISPRAFEEKIKQDFANGVADIGASMEKLSTGLAPDAIEKYADDLYAIDKRYLQPIVNMTNANKVPKFFGTLDSMWKQTALSTPQYVANNRLGNWALMTLAGVTPFDMADAVRLRKLTPQQLASETSFSGILGQEWGGKGIKEYASRAANEIKSGIQNKDWLDTIGGTNRLFAAPFLPLESKMETVDRLAVLLHEGKKLYPGKSAEEIINLMDTDKKVFDTLNEKIKNVLGDYAGRNWAIPNNIYSISSKMVPFNKYPLQSARAMVHQAMYNPLGYQLGFNVPSRIGSARWEKEKKQARRGEEVLGGSFYGRDMGSKLPRSLSRWNAHPFTAATELLYNMGNDPSGIRISPLVDLSRYMQFKDSYGNTASDPRYLNAGGVTLILDGNGNITDRVLTQPTAMDVFRYAGAGLANQFLTPVQQMNRVVLPLVGGSREFNGFYPRYDTSLFGQVGDKPNYSHIFSGKTRTRGKYGAEAFFGPLGGFQFRQIYPEVGEATKRQRAMGKRKLKKLQQQKGNR